MYEITFTVSWNTSNTLRKQNQTKLNQIKQNQTKSPLAKKN